MENYQGLLIKNPAYKNVNHMQIMDPFIKNMYHSNKETRDATIRYLAYQLSFLQPVVIKKTYLVPKTNNQLLLTNKQSNEKNE